MQSNKAAKNQSNEDFQTIENRLIQNCAANGLKFADETPGDGNCFFHAVSSQLRRIGLDVKSPSELRKQMVEYLRQNRIMQGRDGTINIDEVIQFDEWSDRMKGDGEYADHIAVLGVARMLETNILIVQSSAGTSAEKNFNIIEGNANSNAPLILLGHYHESHYQSLEPIPFVVREEDKSSRQSKVQSILLDALKECGENPSEIQKVEFQYTINTERARIERTTEIKFDGEVVQVDSRTSLLPEYPSNERMATGGMVLDVSDDDQDIIKCVKCKIRFTTLAAYTNHKPCRKKIVKSNHKDDYVKDEHKDIQARVTIKTITGDLPQSWKDKVMLRLQQGSNELDTKHSTTDFTEPGSLVIWTKLKPNVVKSRKAFIECMDEFTVNLFSKCRLESKKEMVVSVDVEIIDPSDDDLDDIFICGKCKENFCSLEVFITHKKYCATSRRCTNEITAPLQTTSLAQKTDSESAYSSQISETDETSDYTERTYTKVKLKAKSSRKKKNTSAKKRRKQKGNKSDSGSRTGTSGYETAECSEIELNFQWANEEDNDPYYQQRTEISDDEDIYSDDCKVITDDEMGSNTGADELYVLEDRKLRINYYEMSKAKLRDNTLLDIRMMQNGLQLSDKCLHELSAKFRRKYLKKYSTFYNEMIVNTSYLLSKCEESPNFRRGNLTIISSHKAVCTLLEPYNGFDTVEIPGRSKCGRAYTDDEVVVEIHEPKGKTTHIKRINKSINQSEVMYGKVIGRLKRNRHDGILHPVFVCELDKYEYDKAKPVCKTVPKFHLLSEKHDENPFNIDVYKYDENAKNITFHKTINVSPALRKKFLFYVAYISWKSLYPLGAIIKVHESTTDFTSGLKILELQYKVPTEYLAKTISCVDRDLDNQFMNNKLNRFDLTALNVFTIDPKESSVLDDAISINKLPNGGFRVGVHISDASCYVEINSDVDMEARERGTTFFRGAFGDPHQMLPEPLSTDKCSLKAGKTRLAITVFYHFDKKFQYIRADTKCCKSIIRSREQLSYAEVQNILQHQSTSPFETDICTLFEISKSLRRKRIGDGMFSIAYEFDLVGRDENVTKYPEAYYLIEELMILTNHSIASFLLYKFPDSVPLRCHDPPSLKKLKEWRKKYPLVSDMILKLQGYPIDMNKKISLSNFESPDGLTIRYSNIMFIQKWLWKKVLEYLKRREYEKAAALLRKEELHPFHALAFNEWGSLQTKAEYRCSGCVKGKQARHFNLGIFPYTHFTAPIRRYVDIIVHRLLHAAIDRNSSPYSADEVNNMCQAINIASSRAKEYESQCKSLLLAYKIRVSPVVVHGFINEYNDKEITLVIPGCKFLSKHCRTLKVNLLDVNERPQYFNDTDKLNSVANRKYVMLTWKKRIYSRLRKRPYPKNPSEGYRKLQKYKSQKIDPHQKADVTKMSYWLGLIHKHILEKNVSELKLQEESEEKGETLSRSLLFSSLDTENDVNSETIDAINTGNGRRLTNDVHTIITDQFCKYSMDFRHGQVISIQYSAEMQRGILTPYIQVFDMTRNLKYCLEHMRDPIGCFERYSTTSAKLRYTNTSDYQNVWIPIILMETAMSVVRDSTIVINDVPVTFIDDGGHFTLLSDFCYERNIDLGTMSLNFLENDTQYVPNSDYLCIKCTISTANQEYFQVRKATSPEEYRIWIRHAKVERQSKAFKDTANEKLRIHFKFIASGPIPPVGTGEHRPICSVEILPKPEIDKRIEAILRCLDNSTPLAKAIALNKKPPELDVNHVSRGKKTDVTIGLPLNNTRQTEAIQMALRSSFSLLHGPPGTGKTNMGIKLTVLFNDINRQIEADSGDRKQIIYCGPSNKSVDLVALRLLRLTRHSEKAPRIARLYGSSIEHLDFPIPGRIYSTKHSVRDSKTDENLKAVSIHYLIRQTGKPFAGEINRRYNELTQNSISEIENVKKYIQIIQEATIEELKHYDVVFCTTAMTTNSKLFKGMEGRIFQVIIDECGMVTEPECISTIIATRAQQVVLIGDHMQLQPVVVCPQAKKLGLQKSLFERYHEGKNVVQLEVQYRMHPSICEFPSKEFYSDKLITDEKTKSYVEERPLQLWLGGRKRTIFCHIEGEEEILPVTTEEGNEMSRRNQAEVDQVIKIYSFLHNEEKIFETKGQKITVNIMSQYNDQCAAIRKALASKGFNNVNVNTVVASQGGEWDYVIFSLVRSLPDYRIEKLPTLGWCAQNLGFITDRHQINVALTRAKKGLIIIGNSKLLRCNEVWKKLLQSYEQHNCFVNGHIYPPKFQPPILEKKTPKKKKTPKVDDEGYQVV